MKLEVNISKKLGVINITSNSFVLEDLKAHICKKMKLNENDFKMKISFGDVPKVEMIEVKHEIIKEGVKIVDVVLDDKQNIVSSIDDFFPIEFRDRLYFLIQGTKSLKMGNYNEHWLRFFQNSLHYSIIEIHENIRKNGKDHSKKLLYKIRVIKQAEQKEKKKSPLDPFKQIVQLENEILFKVKKKFSEAEFITTNTNFNGTLKVSIHFKDFKDGEAITYFGDNEKDYNKPINPQLEKRCSAVYKILKPYLGAK